MKLVKNELLRHFAGLSTRKRFLSVATIIGVVIYVLYLLVYKPIAEENSLLKQKIYAQQQAYQHLKTVNAEVLALRKHDTDVIANIDAQSLMQVIGISSKQLEISQATKRMIPDGANKVTLWLEDIAFDKLIHWLAILEQKHAVSIIQSNINQDNKMLGIVDAKLVLGN